MPGTRRASPDGPPGGDPRRTALALLHRWETRPDLRIDRALAEHLATAPDLDPRDRRLLQELTYGVIRRKRRLDFVLDRFCARGIGSVPPEGRCLLRLGAYQILFSDRIPAYAAVNETVRLARRAGLASLAGLVNAVLRRVAAQGTGFPLPDPRTDLVRHLGVRFSFPDWLVGRLLALFGETDAAALMALANQPPPLCLRVNRLRAAPERAVAALREDGADPDPDPVIPFCLRVDTPRPLAALRAFRDGLVQVQDPSSQLVAPVVDPRPGDVVLDACAAPGGKTTHLAELMQDRGRVFALDREPARLEQVRENLARLGIACVDTRLADAAEPLPFLPVPLDRILVDAPCSGLGTLRRRPDLRWRLHPRSFAELAELQGRILDNVSALLRPGGLLVYATCTLSPEENRDLIRAFLARSPGFRLESPAPWLPPRLHGIVDSDGFAETLPFRDGMDGSFLARLRKA